MDKTWPLTWYNLALLSLLKNTTSYHMELATRLPVPPRPVQWLVKDVVPPSRTEPCMAWSEQ